MNKYAIVPFVILSFLVLTAMLASACKISEFACRGGSLCLPLDKYCDGKDDCGDSSDEPKSCTGKINTIFYFYETSNL